MLGDGPSRNTSDDYGILGCLGKKLGYKIQAEYLRVDQIWYTSPSHDSSDWRIDAFIEHENDCRRLLETVRKLLQIGNGLKVIITYQYENKISDEIMSVQKLISERFDNPVGSPIIIVFGTSDNECSYVNWEAHEFDSIGRVSSVSFSNAT